MKAAFILLTTLSGVLAQPAPESVFTNSPPALRDPITRIREEALNHSQVMETLSYLSDVIGPRLTGSPNMKRANEWTRDKLAAWGLQNAHLEPWGPFGRGWSLKRFSAQIVEPYAITLIACPKAWSPGLEQPITAEVIHLDARTEADLEKYKGKLKGAVVLIGSVRELTPRFQPLAVRESETNLLRLANASRPTRGRAGAPPVAPGRRGGAAAAGGAGTTNAVTTNATPAQAGGPGAPGRRGGAPGGRGGGVGFAGRALEFVQQEGAALVVSPSTQGDGGTIFVQSAAIPGGARGGGGRGANAPRVWSTNAPALPPQITLAVEDFNRLARMIRQGVTPKMAVEFEVQFHADDLMSYNTLAEIPGTDLKDEVVMLGGHMDSWQAGTGATDNGAGVAAAMEAVRIIKALDLKPRRTIRIGLWSGEEQGLFGSAAYVNEHFGFETNTVLRSPRAASNDPAADTDSTNATRRVRKKEYEKFSAYFNVDNGAGKIRGIYLQGNEGVRQIFRRWLEPFSDLGAETITPLNTGSTDHVSFDDAGLPGFQFIQDTLEYNSRTHHSNEDVYDRVPPEDLKQVSAIFAAFVWNTAMLDERLSRKAAP